MANTTELQRGAKRYRQRQKQAAIRRVRRYQKWCREDGSFRTMPDVPSKSDYAHARAAGIA